MGKGSGGGDIPDIQKPTEESKFLDQQSALTLQAGREEIQAGAPFRRLLESLGVQAAASGAPNPRQIPGLQRGINILRGNQARQRQNTIDALGSSRLLNTPFGQQILAQQGQNVGLQEAQMSEAARQQQIAGGLGIQNISAGLGQSLIGQGLGGLGTGVSNQTQRSTSMAQLQISQDQANAQINAANSQAIGSGIGSLAAVAAAMMMAPSNPDLKTDVKPASDLASLKAVRKLPISTWRYKGDSVTHLGGMTTDMPDNVIVGDLKTRIGYDPISYLGMLTGAVRALDKEIKKKPRPRKAVTRGK